MPHHAKIPGRSARAALAVLVGASLVLAVPEAAAQNKKEGVQFEVGVAGGVHLFNDNLELGVADDPTLTSPKNAPLFGLRLGLLSASDVRDRGSKASASRPRRATQRRERVHHRRRADKLVYNIMPGEIAGGKFVAVRARGRRHL